MATGQQLQELGQGLQRAGLGAASIALDMAQQANQVRVDDALNQAKEAALALTYSKDSGFTNLKGKAALELPEGAPLTEVYGQKLQKQMSELRMGLGNDAQRRQFDLHANDILTAFRGQAMQHEVQEFRTHALSTSEGIQSTSRRDIVLNYNNPDAVVSAVERIRAETYRQAQLLGKSAEWQEARARELTSGAHRLALLTALEKNDPLYAESYLKRFSAEMEADDILAVRGHITKEMDARVGAGVAAEVIKKALPTGMQASDADRAFNIAVGTESGGRQFGKDGKPLTSPAGAIGIAQVMPGTAPEAAKLAGLPWDENRYRNDADYNRALGKAYFQKQLQENGGDLAKAYAAYNAGPGALRDAVTRAGARPGGDWLSFLPRETQDYVAKNMKAFEAGRGQSPRPTVADIDEALRADPRLANNPARLKIARDEATRLYDTQVKAAKQKDEEAEAAAMRALVQNGGSFSDLPSSLRAAVPPGKVDSLITFGQKIAKGDDTTSPWLYNKLTAHPEQLARMSDDQFFALRKDLSAEDFKHFSGLRAKHMGVTTGTGGAGDLNSEAITRTLEARLRMLGIDPTPKEDSADAARVGAIRRFVDQSILAGQREATKKFDDGEVERRIDGLFAKNVAFRSTVMGINAGTTSMPLLSMKADDIPDDARDSLKAAFKRQGVDNPTPAQLLHAYWTLKSTRR